MDNELAAIRLDRFLREEPVVWLSTVRPDGTPHLVPTWFAWDGEVITIVSKAGAQKVRNLRVNRHAMLALGDAEEDFDVGLIEATAELVEPPRSTSRRVPRQVRGADPGAGPDPRQFARTYSQVIRLTPTKRLGWHGRSTPTSDHRRRPDDRHAPLHVDRRATATDGARPAREPMGRPAPAL